MFRKRIGNSKKKKRAVLTAYGTPENVVMVSVTIHKKGDDPYVMAFFRDPTEADPESLVARAHDWAGRQGIKSIYEAALQFQKRRVGNCWWTLRCRFMFSRTRFLAPAKGHPQMVRCTAGW